ncbi:MAG: TetR/AcrR family transcriptional regulator [Firmicutes bacterium]|nr:TetR/AcrR family transcriptional regulator [Bacillota bacterium]
MPRKAVLSGGRKDEIIRAATEMFFQSGFEATSVRMITDKVGGEIGMFYHYFKSKEDLFDQVVERFFRDFEAKCREMISGCRTPEEFVDAFLPLYQAAMGQYGRIEGGMHWSIRYAMHAKTIDALVPVLSEQLEKMDVSSPLPKELLARQLVYGASATIHSAAFETMKDEEQRSYLKKFIQTILSQ